VFGLGVGPVPVALTWRDGDLRFAWMTQGSPTFSDPIADRGTEQLPRRSARCMRAARLLYSEILERIEAQDYDVFSRRASVPLVRKLSTVVRAGVGRPLASRAADDRRSIVATR